MCQRVLLFFSLLLNLMGAYLYLTSTFNSALPKWNDGHISMYLNDTIIHVVPETQEISCNCTNEPKEKTYDITLVTQTTVERLFYLQYLVTRWHGPFSIAVGYENETLSSIQSSFHYPSVSLAFAKVNATYYPINRLRNIAINRTKTTHFFLADMDFWPSKNLYESFHQLPSHIQQDEWLTIIVPGFQYLKVVPPDAQLQSFVASVAQKIPTTKAELNSCLYNRACQRFRPETKTHSYHYNTWMTEPETKPITMLEKFKYKVQEPYVMIQKTDHMPLFSELFYNYGRNKVQWIEHLRYIGYKFGLLIQGFGVDVPHPPSHFQKEWAYIGKKTNKIPFVDVYNDFVKELYKEPDRSIVYVEKKD